MMKQKIVALICTVMVGSLFFVNGTADAGTSGDTKFSNPIGYDNVDNLVTSVGATVKNLVAGLAVLMIVVGGILYITSAGDSGRVELAKKAITSALVGLALALAAPAFLFEIYKVLGADQPAETEGSKRLIDIIIDTITFLSSLVGALSVLMLLVGGVMYMTSGGDSTKADTAKNIIKYAMIGLIVALLALIIVTQVIGFF